MNKRASSYPPFGYIRNIFDIFLLLQVPFIDRRQISRDHRSVCRQVSVAQMYASVSASYLKALIGSYRTYQELLVI